MSIVSPFRVDIIYHGLNVGTPTTILELNNTNSLDKIGSLSFKMPSQDRFTQYLIAGTYFDVYDDKDGSLGTYLFKSKSITDQNGISITQVECYDTLKELTFETVGFNRTYEYQPVSDVIQDLVVLYPGWTANVESGLGNTTIDYQGESIFRAIDEQRDRNVAHFRLKQSRVLDFGYFGDISEIVFTNMRGQHQPDFDNNPNIALVTAITVNEESDDIYNKVIPLGFGQGVTQLTIERASLGDYEVQIGTNQDFSPYYYIQNELSSTKYGTRTRILSLPNIRPLDNNDQNIINAANALKLTAESYLARNLEPKSEYSIQVSLIKKPLYVGQLVKVDYKGVSDNYKYVEIDDYFYVMDITRNRNVDGSRNFTVTISSVDIRRTSDQDIMIDVVRDLRSLNIHIPATLSYFQNSDNKRIAGNIDVSQRTNAEFTLRMKEEILYLNRALLQFTTSALQTDATGVAAGGSSVQTSTSSGAHRHQMFYWNGNHAPNSYINSQDYGAVGDAAGTSPKFIAVWDNDGGNTDDIYTFEAANNHSHDINIPSHTHDLVFGLFEDTVFPQHIGIVIDGIDYTTQLLEQINETDFSPLDTQSYTYEVDITSILNIDLKRNHSIVFYANSDTQGSISVNINCLVTIQPIRID